MDGTADQVAVVLGVSPRSADHLLGDAIALVGRPLVWGAVYDAMIDQRKGLLIVQGLEGFDGLPRAQMERDAIAYAQSHTAHELRRYLIKLACDGDPGDIFRKEAVDRRGVSIFPAGHGMADVSARLSLEHAEMFFQRLTALAQKDDCPDPYGQGADRTLDQCRADALVGFLEDTTEVSVHVDVTISADALIGEDHRDAMLGSHGAIPASLARLLAWSPDARWRRLVTDPLTGALIDCNAEVYKVPDRVKRAVRLRDRTCRFPGLYPPGRVHRHRPHPPLVHRRQDDGGQPGGVVPPASPGQDPLGVAGSAGQQRQPAHHALDRTPGHSAHHNRRHLPPAGLRISAPSRCGSRSRVSCPGQRRLW